MDGTPFLIVFLGLHSSHKSVNGNRQKLSAHKVHVSLQLKVQNAVDSEWLSKPYRLHGRGSIFNGVNMTEVVIRHWSDYSVIVAVSSNIAFPEITSCLAAIAAPSTLGGPPIPPQGIRARQRAYSPNTRLPVHCVYRVPEHSSTCGELASLRTWE